MTRHVVLRSPGERIALALPHRGLLVAFGLLAALLAVIALSLMSGSYPLEFSGVRQTLTGAPPDQMAATVVWEFRFPRLLAAILVGAMLGLSGAILQNVTLNPLADPSLVGVSQGASLAVVTLIVVFPGAEGMLRPVAAFGGALAVAALIQGLAAGRSGGATMRFILTGIGIAAFLAALTSALLTYGQVAQAMSALGWLSGSIHSAGWDDVQGLALAGLVLLPALVWAVGPLSALRFGSEMATGLGVAVRPARIGLITLAVALAAFAVASVGPLGFVGLVAPHLARRFARTGTGMGLLLTGLTGGLLVAGADLFGRTAFGTVQIPAGIVTSLLGVPVLVLVILRGQARSGL